MLWKCIVTISVVRPIDFNQNLMYNDGNYNVALIGLFLIPVVCFRSLGNKVYSRFWRSQEMEDE